MKIVFSLTILFILITCLNANDNIQQQEPSEINRSSMEDELIKFFNINTNNTQSHSNNWVVLIDSSRFWFNYRHVANALSFYHVVKQLGIPDSQIILMLADDVACNARNRFPARVFNNKKRQMSVYGEDVEVDYRGYEVTVEQFFRVLTGRHSDAVPTSKRLMSDEHSNVLVFMTGHGGDEFFKFQDQEEINSADIADVIQQMFERKRFRELLMVVDTCQAGSLFTKLYTPNVIAIGSSSQGQNSYSHHADSDIGVAIIDRFTYYTLDFFERRRDDFRKLSLPSLKQWFDTYDPNTLYSTPVVRSDLFPKSLQSVPITDFFGSNIKVKFQSSKYDRSDNNTLLIDYIPKHTNEEYILSFHVESELKVDYGMRLVEKKDFKLNMELLIIFIVAITICFIFK
ncbi:hypothetical protein ABK040_001808 [Willaertia magna]